jgi:ABC-type oligopeptide transport system substrate-binding subunit
MAFQAWVADYPDPDSFLRVGLKENLAGWRDEAYERLVEIARRKQDQYERIELYQQADKMLIDKAVVLPLFYDMEHLLIKPWLKNFHISPMRDWFLKDVIIEPH